MKTVQKILLFAVALGVIVTGTLAILIVLNLTSLEDSRESLIRILTSVGIGTAIAIVVLLLSRVFQKK